MVYWTSYHLIPAWLNNPVSQHLTRATILMSQHSYLIWWKLVKKMNGIGISFSKLNRRQPLCWLPVIQSRKHSFQVRWKLVNKFRERCFVSTECKRTQRPSERLKHDYRYFSAGSHSCVYTACGEARKQTSKTSKIVIRHDVVKWKLLWILCCNICCELLWTHVVESTLSSTFKLNKNSQRWHQPTWRHSELT